MYERQENETDFEYKLRLCKAKINKEIDLEWQEIINILGLDISYDHLRKTAYGMIEYDNYIKKENDIAGMSKPRLVISDLHLPYAVNGWLDFIKDTYHKYNCQDEIIINGDLITFDAMSFHQKETDAPNGIDEYAITYDMVQQLVKAFPNAKMTIGNHDLLLVRQNKAIGIDKRFVKTLHELFDLPATWTIADDLVIDDVYYRHQGCSGGTNGARNSAVNNRMSTVVSHLHSFGGISFITNPNGDTIFGLNTGALIDDNSISARYGKLNKQKSTLGCGVVFNSQHAIFEPYISSNYK